MFVKPGPRQDDRDRPLVVRAPNGRCLSPLGEEVPDTQFWHRRLRDEDVVPATPIPMSPVVVRIGPDGHAEAQESGPIEPAPEKIGPRSGPMCREASAALGELIADGEPHVAMFAGEQAAEPALVPDEIQTEIVT